ncbi:hypothetical protein ABK040_000347 [Willaertia magna]
MSLLENWKDHILANFPVNKEIKSASTEMEALDLDKFKSYYNFEAIDPCITKNSSNFIATNFKNGFIHTCFLAYSYHYPLILSPDHVWLAIAQGLAKHVKHNSVKLKRKFLNAKRIIEIDGSKYGIKEGDPNNDWPSVINEFTEKIDGIIKTNAKDLVECNFSTTDASSKIASKICLMDAMKRYFKYEVNTSCGLPQVTLLGTLQDWHNIRKRTELIGKEYDLEWWTEKLLPIIDKFIESAKGNIDESFWNKICHFDGGCGGSFLSGWIINFLPYVGKERNDFREVDLNDISKGLSKAPFYLDSLAYEFVGGFLGVAQMSDSFALMPVIGWGVKRKKEF